MIVIPAIDLKDGQVVRLYKGKFDDVTAYDLSPVETAQNWQAKGAKLLHVVDLDGAQTGIIKNIAIIKAIVENVQIPVQVGGGVRDEEVVKSFLESGVSRVILGTRVVENQMFLDKMLAQWGERIIVSIDCANGFVARRGWTTSADVRGIDLAQELQGRGLKTIVYTDIARDGTLQGLNFDGVQEMLKTVNMNVIASGGVSSIMDIQRCVSLTKQFSNLFGVITGKAIYEGKLDFKEAVDLLK
ncbi:MAG: 1-(5-phosphoribosyl)-5-[(5-phosphoribosylamino)methylideneamino]imidazole-4-carboxamide isomerase [Candidatus Omnitrophota bacterium]|nr:1-(5-phosphoribosyl)-5-[(5-phosphoribosylamino)methylideneamino]imidazole-4-carboxamide isomerase [Candidatus Omnitrophota bacterium]